MSLLDDVSIVVTPNGYKAGELYAVVPTYALGSEEITNGDFATDSDWTKGTGVTISVGKAELLNTPTFSFSLEQVTGLTVGLTYLVSYEIDDYISGQLRSRLGSNLGATISNDGVYEERIVAQSNSLIFQTVGVSFTGSIKNVSVKELTSADMDVTRATAATRVDENGLVNYAEVLGSELAICGDFECASPLTGWTVNSDGAISIDSGKLKVLNVTNRGRSFRTYTGLTIGKTYEAFVGNTSGNITGFCHITSGTANNNITLNAPFFFVAGATTAEFQCGVGSTIVDRFTFFDNISLKQNDRDNVPRIDYTGGGCPHILAEPQRNNLIPYSEAFNSWNTIQFVTVAEDTSETTSPSGNNTASKITINSASTVRRLFEVISTSSGSDYTFTLYAKKGTTDYIRFFISSNIYDVTFDLTNGTKTVTTGSGRIESVGNDWYRLEATGTSSLTTEVPQIQLSNSASVNDYLYIWGSQFEEGSYPTSYIPTIGSTVTRNQDIFTRDGIGSLINSTEGVLFVEMAALSNDSTRKAITLSDGTTSNRVMLRYQNSSNAIQCFINVGGVLYSNLNESSYTITDFLKIAFKWKAGDFALWINGTEVATSTDATSFGVGVLTELQFNEGDGAGSEYFGKVRQLQVYNTALTDAQLTSLTS